MLVEKVRTMTMTYRNEFSAFILSIRPIDEIELLFNDVNQWLAKHNPFDEVELVVTSIGTTRRCSPNFDLLMKGVIRFVENYKTNKIWIYDVHNHPSSGYNKNNELEDTALGFSRGDYESTDYFINRELPKFQAHIRNVFTNKYNRLINNFSLTDILAVYGSDYLDMLHRLSTIELYSDYAGVFVHYDKLYARFYSMQEITNYLNKKSNNKGNKGGNKQAGEVPSVIRIAINAADILNPDLGIKNKKFIVVFSRYPGFNESYVDRFIAHPGEFGSKEYFVYATDNLSYAELKDSGALKFILRKRMTRCFFVINKELDKLTTQEELMLATFEECIEPVIIIDTNGRRSTAVGCGLTIQPNEVDVLRDATTIYSNLVNVFRPNATYNANPLKFVGGYNDKVTLEVSRFELNSIPYINLLIEYYVRNGNNVERKVRLLDFEITANPANIAIRNTVKYSVIEDILLHNVEKAVVNVVFLSSIMIPPTLNSKNLFNIIPSLSVFNIIELEYKVKFNFEVHYIYDSFVGDFASYKRIKELIDIKF